MKLMVHPFDRLHNEFNRELAYQTEDGFFAARVNKDGSFRRNDLLYEQKNPVCELRACQLCGLLGSKRMVSVRNDCYGWNREHNEDWSFPHKDMLCCGCWNKARSLKKRQQDHDDVRRLVNKTLKELKNERSEKHSDDRPIA